MVNTRGVLRTVTGPGRAVGAGLLLSLLTPICRSNPTYLRVYARQRPGGVAWDAVPLTVRGLNKAAGNLNPGRF